MGVWCCGLGTTLDAHISLSEGLVCVPLIMIQPSANTHPKKQQVMDQVLGPLPLMWETQIEFWTSDFSQGQPWLLQVFGEQTKWTEGPFPSLSLKKIK